MSEKSYSEGTMLTREQIAKAAHDLYQAELTKKQIDLISNRHPGFTWTIHSGCMAWLT